MSDKKRIGYGREGTTLPPIKTQKAALKKADCDTLFLNDTTDNHDDMDDGVLFMASQGDLDTVVICKPTMFGSPKAAAQVVRELGASGVAVEVIGQGAKIYIDPEDIAGFEKVAMTVSRSASATHMLETRQGAGRKAKWKPQGRDEAILRILWHGGAHISLCLEMAALLSERKDITRENIIGQLGNRKPDPRKTDEGE